MFSHSLSFSSQAARATLLLLAMSQLVFAVTCSMHSGQWLCFMHRDAWKVFISHTLCRDIGLVGSNTACTRQRRTHHQTLTQDCFIHDARLTPNGTHNYDLNIVTNVYLLCFFASFSLACSSGSVVSVRLQLLHSSPQQSYSTKQFPSASGWKPSKVLYSIACSVFESSFWSAHDIGTANLTFVLACFFRERMYPNPASQG